jgi:CheY-like chemotaxis protein
MMQTPYHRVLVVGDEQAVCRPIVQALAAARGVALRLCGDMHEALAAAPQFEPDLLVLDVLLPGQQAQQLLAALRATPRFVDLPVVFVTSRAGPEDHGDFQALAAIGELPDVFDPVTRSATTRSLRERRAAYDSRAIGA